MTVQIEHFNLAFPNRLPLEFFFNRHSLNVRRFRDVQPSDCVL